MSFHFFCHFSRRFYPKRLTYVRLTMYTHFTFTLMARCTSGAIRGSVSCSRTLRQGIKLATFRLLNDFSTPVPMSPRFISQSFAYILLHFLVGGFLLNLSGYTGQTVVSIKILFFVFCEAWSEDHLW